MEKTTAKGKGGVHAFRRKRDYVTPSGIQCGLLSLIGKHQKDITINEPEQRKKNIDLMLLDCLSFIGDNRNLTVKDIESILEPDRKALLFQIRQLSNKDNKTFKFKYEFPTKGKKKLSQIYEVDFEEEKFPCKPYKWVRDKMEKHYREKNGITGELTEQQEKEVYIDENGEARPFPKMFSNYSDMLAKHKNQKSTLPECGVEVHWELLDVRQASKTTSGDRSQVSSHTMIEIRKAKFINQQLTEDPNKPVYHKLPLDEMDILDIEGLRGNIVDVEASVETSVVVQYGDNPDIQSQVDLVATPAFFFPSLAL